MKMYIHNSVQHMGVVARDETYKENDDIIKGWQFVATLDDRMSTVCASLDGQVFDIGTGPLPPLHPNCRSVNVPALDDRFAALEKGATRIARGPDGDVYQVPADMTYYEWLKTQPPEFQNAAIGKTRAELLRSGELTSKRFAELNLGPGYVPRTLAEMRAAEPLVFERAENAKNLEMGARSAGAAESPLAVGERYGLTREETRSILKYTTSESYRINEKLRNGIPLDAQDVELVSRLDSALEKMPSYEGTVFRSVDVDDAAGFIKSHTPGRPFLSNAYTSSGTHVYDETMSVQYIIKSKTGRDIRAFNEAEGEVLFRRGTKFFISKIDGNTIYMMEI